MSNVKRNRRRSRRPRIHLAIGKIPAPLPQIFLGQLQCVQDRAPNRLNIRFRTAQPRLD
jgi:hypothetical protein